jgi:hypothetical protein
MSLIEINGSGKAVQCLPVGSLKRFGTNPYGDAMFRVVWSESRYYLVGGEHVGYDGDPSPDRVVKARGKDPNVNSREKCYKWLPLYPSVHRWVLECWKSGLAFTGCTPEQYRERYLDLASGLLILGPYPDRGEYVQCFTFPSVPTISVVEGVINRIKAGWNYTYQDHLRANREELERKEKSKLDTFKDMFKDSQQAFNNRPSNIRPGKRTKDSIRLRYSAKDVPIKPRGFSTGAI